MGLPEIRRANLELLLQGMTAVELAGRSGVHETLISRYRRGVKQMREDTARRLERAAAKPPRWMDEQHSSGGPQSGGMAHPLIQQEPEDHPTIVWEKVMADRSSRFWVLLPDDAMAPRAPAGRRILFDRMLDPRRGDGVLVLDRFGTLHFRQYRAGAGGRWTAAALNEAFELLDSERDGLTVIAVLCAEEGRWG